MLNITEIILNITCCLLQKQKHTQKTKMYNFYIVILVCSQLKTILNYKIQNCLYYVKKEENCTYIFKYKTTHMYSLTHYSTHY